MKGFCLGPEYPNKKRFTKTAAAIWKEGLIKLLADSKVQCWRRPITLHISAGDPINPSDFAGSAGEALKVAAGIEKSAVRVTFARLGSWFDGRVYVTFREYSEEYNDVWRPEGWDELEMEKTAGIAEKYNMPLGPTVAVVMAFEAGAQAIIEQLRKNAVDFDQIERGFTPTFFYSGIAKRGQYCFVGDDEGK